jgi:HPt (histidine-containing phosphotransfer) domain-containing protein
VRTLDPDLLVRNLDGDPELLARVVGLFFEASDEILARIRRALDESDAPALRKKAHELRGALANVGAEAAAQAAKELESLAAGAALRDAGESLHVLEKELEKLRPALEALVAAARR